ncbi:MAG TPA: CapA family protein [Rhodanobacter sp.]|nr:CapA family protein [Rhodanobacter sp.]
MTEAHDPQRRRLLVGLAASPLLLLCGATSATSAPRTLTLTLTGQALIAHDLCAEDYPGLADVIAEIRRGDAAMTDLETAIRTAASGAPTREGVFLHQAGMAELRCVREMGFDALALANNHAGDFGREGVLATRQAAHDTGFHTAGSGGNLAEASHATRFMVAGQPVALVAMAAGKIRAGAATATLPGINELRLDGASQPDAEDVARIHASIRAAADSSRVIAYLHNHDWGDDLRVTREWTRQFAKSCVDAGASAFFAHGAPLLHGIELHRGAPIFYCLGSLIFHSRTPPGHYLPEVWESAIAHLHYRDGQLRQLELVPVVLNERGDDAARQNETRGRPRIATGGDAQRILTRLQALSGAFGTSLRIARARGWIEVG